MAYKLEKKIINKKAIDSTKRNKTAHQEATKAEKKKFPKGYEKLKKDERKLGKDQYMGMNYDHGKTKISKVVPKSLRKEVLFHETFEKKTRKRLEKKGKA